jgi:acetamidase/formamidase
MDVNELQVGSTLYFQVFQKGGLIWTGGFSLLAGERRSEPDRPGMFFDEDLNEAMKIAVREAVNFLAEQKIVPMSREEAYSLTSIVGHCRVSQVVDIREGVHCMIPKSIFTKK